jgi:hypothetical protein
LSFGFNAEHGDASRLVEQTSDSFRIVHEVVSPVHPFSPCRNLDSYLKMSGKGCGAQRMLYGSHARGPEFSALSVFML